MAKILVIDDDSHFRGVIERIILRNYPCSVTTAATEEEAWEELAKNPFDLVFLDLYIDGKKSWDSLRRIRTLPSPPVIIVISCEDLKENADYARHLGAADFVAKPIDFGRLKMSVDAALERRKENLFSRRRADEQQARETAEEVALLVLVREENRHEVREAFDSHGFRVLEAKDPSHAAETVERENLDVVLVSMASGVCHAADLVRTLRNRARKGLGLPIIALTDHDPDTILAALKAGVDDYIGLPADRRILAGKVGAQVRQRRRYERRLSKAFADTVKDPFSGTYNDAYFLVRLGEEIARSRRHGRSMTLAIIGLFGTEAESTTPEFPGGDKVLSGVSRVLRRAFRDSDVLGRWGENGFAVILPETTAVRIGPRAGSIRVGIEERVAEISEGRGNARCCIGLASLPSAAEGLALSGSAISPGDLVAMADKALERAVSSGTGMVEIFSGHDSMNSGMTH